jgi:hypothetical protein
LPSDGSGRSRRYFLELISDLAANIVRDRGGMTRQFLQPDLCITGKL